MTVFRDDLVAVGAFSGIDGVPAANIARWDGEEWHPLGSGTDAGISSAEPLGDELVVAGSFTAAGGVPVNHIARWNGIEWMPMGSGTNDRIWTMDTEGNDVFTGGLFTLAGGKASYSIARWRAKPSGSVRVPGAIAFEPPFPNPFSNATRLTYTLSDRGPTRIDVFDVSGRLVRHIQDRIQAAGDHSLFWDGRLQDGRLAPAGSYYLRVAQGRTAETRPVIRLWR